MLMLIYDMVNGYLQCFASADSWLTMQVTNFWNNVLKEDERTRLAQNIAGHVKDAKPFIQERTVSVLCFVVFFNPFTAKGKFD